MPKRKKSEPAWGTTTIHTNVGGVDVTVSGPTSKADDMSAVLGTLMGTRGADDA